MDSTRQPESQLARQRLREAQRQEARALTMVERAIARRDRAVERLAAAQVAPQRRLDEAEQELSRARAALAEVSGFDRAATLLAQPPAAVRADLRAARAATAESTSTSPPVTEEQSTPGIGEGGES
ncbi:hypothetical protein [Segeticoccus rhizosphaerae]|uniref:hypothetical protein n=1 Tax=Segeticoccus rhizosphaerae TaxID=1104777 RepID=UPI0012643C89|nr:hypothetical protein [Segeticoccus rhizosphaerae]